MNIDLKAPTNWQDVTAEQLRDIVELATKELSREEYLLVLLCKFSNIKMVAGTTIEDGKKVVHTRFKDAEGNVFGLDEDQVSDFCGRLAFVFEDMPMDISWPFRWDRYLMDTTFGNWFHADALMLGFSMSGNIEHLKGAMNDLGDPHPGLQSQGADFVLMLKWYDCFKNWLRERYPLVFQRAEPGTETAASPIEARQNIMLMLNDGHPQDNEKIENANVHDVFAALQHKIEEAKYIEEQMSKYKH